jgi:hypothetical protein
MARDDDDVLEELKDRYLDATTEWEDIREEGATDMRCIAGDPWDPEDRRARDDAGRPCLALDELGQYTNQVINDLRSNKRGIVVSPKGAGANDLTAKFRQGKIREIEYQSHATQAYTTLAENAIQRGYGFLRITARYCYPDHGFDQDLYIEPVVNPDLVTPDPDHVRTDGSDLKYLFYEESRTVKDFARDFPNATIKTFSGDLMRASRGWVNGDQLRVAEYWVKEPGAPRELLLLKPGPPTPANPNPQPMELYRDAINGVMPSSDQVLKTRVVTPITVQQYLTNGVEILETTTWLGPSIPWVCCYGKVIYLQDAAGRASRQLLSLIRLARDPYMLYCYYRTCQAELVGMTPKFPYFVAKGQLDATNLALLAQSLSQPVAVIEYLTKTMAQPEGGLGPPMRQPFEPPIQALEMGAEGARRAIQAAIGASPLPTMAQRHNEKSGVALKTIEDTAQRGSFHFVDHHDEAVMRCGQILDECIPKYYDTARETAIRDPKDQAQVVRINDPAARNPDGQPAHVDTQQGEHEVTISVGPKKDSEREAASDFADQLIGSPQIAQVIGPQKMTELLAASIRLKNLGPIGDEMADTIAPADKQKVDPRQLQHQLQEQGAQMQKLQQIAAQQQQQIETDQIKTQGQIQIKHLDLQFQREKLAVESETKISVAELGAKVDRLQLFVEERARLGVQAADLVSQRQDAAHEVGMAAQQHGHDRRMQDDAHAQAMMQSAQDYQAQARLGAQAQPTPDQAGSPMLPPANGAGPDQAGA